MGTKIYGSLDENIHFEGDISGQVDCCGTNHRATGILIACSDGTVLDVKYCKNISGVNPGIWGITVLNKGDLFDKIEIYTDNNTDIYSDIVYLQDGIKSAYVSIKKYWTIIGEKL